MPHAPIHKSQKAKNIALALSLVGTMVVLFAITVVRIKGL